MRKYLVIGGVVIFAIIVLVAGTSLLQQHGRKSETHTFADSFVASTLKGDSASTYKLLAPNTQKSLDQTTWDGQISQFSRFFTGKTPVYRGTALHGDTSTITYSLVGGDGTYTISVILQPSGKSWQVQLFTSTLNK